MTKRALPIMLAAHAAAMAVPEPERDTGPRGFPRKRSEAAARRASRKATKAKLKQQRHTRRKRK